MVDSSTLVNLIREYHRNPVESSWEQLREVLEPYVYFFPKRVYKAPQLFCGDFYLYIQPKLQSIISSYPLESKYTFKTWFNQVLINQYADFSKQRVPEVSCEPLHEDIPNTCASTNIKSPFTCGGCALDKQENILWDFIHHPDTLSPEMIICLSCFTEQKIDYVLSHYYKMLVLQKIRYQEEQQISINLDLIEQKILIYKERIENLPNPARWLAKKERLENRKARLLRSILLTEKKSRQLATEIFADPKRGARILSRIKQKLRHTSTNTNTP
ncbi:MAG: hypothetical protein ACRCY4_06740 [Brevinema sp.]